MLSGDACTSFDLLTRLSPKDGDEGLHGVGVFGGELNGYISVAYCGFVVGPAYARTISFVLCRISAILWGYA